MFHVEWRFLGVRYIVFFFPIIFPFRPLLGVTGTNGWPVESLGVLSHCDCKLGQTIEKVWHVS